MRKITITGGRMVFAPIPYHTFEVGPLTVEIEVADGATNEEVAAQFDNARQFLEERAQTEFEDKLVQFFDKLKHVDEYMTSIGMTPRGQQPYGQNSSTPAPRQQTPSTGAPQALSQAQFDLIQRRAEAAGVDATAVAKEQYGVSVAELSKAQASALIDHLGDLNGTPRRPQERSAGGQSPSYSNEAPTEPVKFPSDPVARTLADMITTKQLGMIRAVAKEAHVDADEECFEQMSCQVTELSRRGASALIDHLRQLAARNAGQGQYDQR